MCESDLLLANNTVSAPPGDAPPGFESPRLVRSHVSDRSTRRLEGFSERGIDGTSMGTITGRWSGQETFAVRRTGFERRTTHEN